MTVILELPPEIEADLLAQARAAGLELPKYVERLIRERIPVRSRSALAPAERAAGWRESALGLPHTPPLSDDAISRENIYGDRGR